MGCISGSMTKEQKQRARSIAFLMELGTRSITRLSVHYGARIYLDFKTSNGEDCANHEPIFPRLQATDQDGRPQSKAQATASAKPV
jgi:hypothetical protein